MNILSPEYLQWQLAMQLVMVHGRTELQTLLIDMDEVTAELMKFCCLEHHSRFGGDLIDCKGISEWSFGAKNFGYLFDTPGIFRQLEVVPGAQEVLKELHDEGYNIFFLTSPWEKNSVAEKYDWVDEHFPFIGWRKMIPTNFKDMVTGDILFDDSPKNLGTYTKGLVVALNRGYNQDSKPHARVNTWYEFGELVRGINKFVKELKL